MPGIPQVLLLPLIQALRDCNEFQTQSRLYSIFTNEELWPWKDGLPEASSLSERVDLTISYLIQKRRKNGESVLVVFLQILASKYDLEDERHERLLTLTDQLNWLTKRPPRHEAKTLESNPTAVQMLWMGDAEKMLACARSVAMIKVPHFVDGRPEGVSTGTAWLLTNELALTCRHVINARGPLEPLISPEDLKMQIDNALLTFDYTTAGKGIQYKISSLEYPAFDSSPLDYALFRLEERPDFPLVGRRYLKLDVDAPLTAQTSLYIIQHPLGQPQQGAGDVFVGPSQNSGYILYKTPTEPGTSGSPVFNRDNWRVVALHRGENMAADAREGLLIKAILSDLETHRQDLFEEILKAQRAEV